MNPVNYSQVYTKLTKGLSPKTKDIFDRRFGVKTGSIETLESIGDSMGITRERVRQIEEVGFNFVRKNNKETLETLFAGLADYFKTNGGFKNEDNTLEELGGKKSKPYVLFLLTLGDQFARICEKKDHTNFWFSNQVSGQEVKEKLASLVSDISKHGSLLAKEELFTNIASKHDLDEATFASYLGISKKIQSNKEGKLGLIDWPEIKPRGVRDKAFLVFKKHQKPLHFTQITTLIDGLEFTPAGKKTHPQTVHNELIKDPRFVLVGRGMYALNEWGYVPGTIKDIITKVLNEKQEPTHKDDIIKEVLQQRLVAKNTVLMNLNNKKYFQKDNDKYFLRETQTA